jgi:drug/metabolite transporter (DMT)-like permease
VKQLQRNKPFLVILLLTVAAIWGSGFVVMKDTLQRLDVNSFLTWRFLIATLVMIALKPSALKKIDRPFALKGGIAGAILGIGYILQSFGLTMTTVAKTGFITGLYAVFTPLIAAFILKKHVTRFQWFCVALALAGLALLSFNGVGLGHHELLGESLVLVSALVFAVHIIALSEWSSSLDTYTLTILQMAMVTVVCFIASMKSGFHMPPDAGVWRALIYTGIFASAFAFIVQTWTQSFMPATTIGIILTMEYIFAAFFGIIVLHEKVTIRLILGGSLVIAAMLAIVKAEPKSEMLGELHYD